MRAILTYHSIDSSGSVLSVDAATFRRHVTWLSSGRVRVMTIPQLAEFGPDTDAVALTFDDGFANFATVAWPLLREHGLPATVFVVTDHVGATNAWERSAGGAIPILPLLGWDALGQLAAEGATIGSHSRTHPHLTALDRERLVDEVAGSAALLRARLGGTAAIFAYPYGAVNDRVAALVRDTYRWGCTTALRPLEPGVSAHLLARLDMYYLRGAGRLEAWGSPGFRRYLWLRAQARRVREALVG